MFKEFNNIFSTQDEIDRFLDGLTDEEVHEMTRVTTDGFNTEKDFYDYLNTFTDNVLREKIWVDKLNKEIEWIHQYLDKHPELAKNMLANKQNPDYRY